MEVGRFYVNVSFLLYGLVFRILLCVFSFLFVVYFVLEVKGRFDLCFVIFEGIRLYQISLVERMQFQGFCWFRVGEEAVFGEMKLSQIVIVYRLRITFVMVGRRLGCYQLGFMQEFSVGLKYQIMRGFMCFRFRFIGRRQGGGLFSSKYEYRFSFGVQRAVVNVFFNNLFLYINLNVICV